MQVYCLGIYDHTWMMLGISLLIEIRIWYAKSAVCPTQVFDCIQHVQDQEIKHDSFIAALLIKEARIITQWQADTIDHTIDNHILMQSSAPWTHKQTARSDWSFPIRDETWHMLIHKIHTHHKSFSLFKKKNIFWYEMLQAKKKKKLVSKN